MNHKIRVFLSLGILLLIAAGSVSAQSLFNNAYHMKAVDLQKKAETAFDNGEYDESIRYSQDARIFTSLSELYGTLSYYRYKANSGIVAARERLNYAQRIKADENFPGEYSSAVASLGEAVRLFDQGELSFREVLSFIQNVDAAAIPKDPFDTGTSALIESSLASGRVISSLKDIKTIVKKPEPEKIPEPVVLAVPVDPTKSDVLPKYYTVQLNELKRDCLWRIAGFSFVFGDPEKWRLLYNLNKNKFPDPKNPDWIEPGIVLEIPSIKGEKREGTYDPAKTYPVFK